MPPQNWSLTSSLGRTTGAVLTGAGSRLAEFAVTAWHLLGLTATALPVIAFWKRHHLRRPVYAVGLDLTTVAVLGPATRPWYVLWGLFLTAAAAPDGSVRLRRTAVVASSTLALAVLPSGSAPDNNQLLIAVGGSTLGVAALWCAYKLTERTAGRAPFPPPSRVSTRGTRPPGGTA